MLLLGKKKVNSCASKYTTCSTYNIAYRTTNSILSVYVLQGLIGKYSFAVRSFMSTHLCIYCSTQIATNTSKQQDNTCDRSNEAIILLLSTSFVTTVYNLGSVTNCLVL